MPEGDTYARYARRLRLVLRGTEITSVTGSEPVVRRWSPRIIGRRVHEVRSRGKSLLVDLDNGITVSAHLGMNGRVQLRTQPADSGSERLGLGNDSHRVLFFAARIDVERTRVIESRLDRLGPDLLAEEFDYAEFLNRARAFPARGTVSDFLLDQRVMAGVGNIFKNEVLFLERLHPSTPVEGLEPDRISALVERSRRLLAANVGNLRRSTTGLPGPGGSNWVYDRYRQPCRRCGQPIERAMIGHPPRVTFWCPSCQPLVTSVEPGVP